VNHHLLDRRTHGILINSLLAVLLIIFSPWSAAEPAPETSPKTPVIKFYVEDIKSTMRAYVASQLDANGLFHLKDDKTGEILALKFVMVHDPVRQIHGDIYFACTDFHAQGEPEKIYDIDFWMDGSSGELKVYDTKVHKEPRSSLLYGWYKHPRYTFVNDEIEYLY
jgi:hypothetical protein